MQQNPDGTAVQLVSVEQAKEAAEAYVQKNLPGYTIETVVKDEQRPMYVATVKNNDGAVMLLWIHGANGQVMHAFPKTAE